MTKNIYKIAVLGMGGVGGYLGARLADTFRTGSEAQITFLARGDNLRAIQSGGLKLITPRNEIVVHPHQATDTTHQITNVDLLIGCVKDYDLSSALEPLKNSVGSQTIILPFLNGLDVSQRIRNILPEARTGEGCAYILAQLTAPGVVRVTRADPFFYFGGQNISEKELARIERIFGRSGVRMILSKEVTRKVWEKFLFISPFATITSALDLSVGSIVASAEHKDTFRKLSDELFSVAQATGIHFDRGVIDANLVRLGQMPFDATSSMHNDFKIGKPTELGALTRQVIELGKKTGVLTPQYDMSLAAIIQNWKVPESP